MISESYRELNRKMHERPEYGISGARYAGQVAELCEKLKTKDVLDYGCGKRTLEEKLGFQIRNFDPSIKGLDARPDPADLVVCTDVLEHIEPEHLDAVLDDLQRLVVRAGYFVVATRPAMKFLEDGRNAHLIQQDLNWWLPKLKSRFTVENVEDHGGGFIVVVTKKIADHFLAVKSDGYRYLYKVVNKYTEGRVRTLFSKEPDTIDWICRMKKDAVLVDVGANVGMYTVFAGVRGLKVHAFEPESQNYAILNENIVANGIDATAYCVALSTRIDISQLYLSSFMAGTSCHTFGDSLDHRLEERPATLKQGSISFPLDEFDIKADHVKIDVDGIEHKVLEGGEKTIRGAKSVLIEINSNLEEHKEILAQMRLWEFSFDEQQVMRARRTEGPFKGCGNVIFRR